jgi:hypothetical protein
MNCFQYAYPINTFLKFSTSQSLSSHSYLSTLCTLCTSRAIRSHRGSELRNPPRSNPECSNRGTLAQAFASSSSSYGDYPSRVSHNTVHDIHWWVTGMKNRLSSPQRCSQHPRSLVLQFSVNTQSTTTQLKLDMPFNSQSHTPPLGGLTLRSIRVPREIPDNTVNSYNCTVYCRYRVTVYPVPRRHTSRLTVLHE